MERLQEKLLQKKAKSLPKVILFGDSLTAYSFHDDEGFGSTLTKHYGGRAEVEDHGMIVTRHSIKVPSVD